MAEQSSVFGLRHQARCLTAVTSSTEKSKFLAGTVGAKDNVVCLLDYDDDNLSITPTMYNHPEEVWDIASYPLNENLLFTCHSPVSGNPLKKRATLWEKPIIDKSAGDIHNMDQRHTLTPLLSLQNEGIKKVLWDTKNLDEQIVSINSTTIYLSSLKEATEKNILTIDASSVLEDENDTPYLRQLENIVWNPHQPEVITVGGNSLSGWDLRSGKNSFHRKGAHESTIRAVDCNPNKPYHIVTGGDDALVRIWDARNLKDPITNIESHTHWVCSVAFNQLQDQLLLSSGSDTLVNLHNTISVSSASYLEDSSDDEKSSSSEDSERKTAKPKDGLICTYDQHEDSVYKVVWSPADTWTFASISYAGRLVISQVPTEEKFKILGV